MKEKMKDPEFLGNIHTIFDQEIEYDNGVKSDILEEI